MLSVAVDIGGTFTDVVCRDSEGGLRYFKVPTTRSDESIAVLRSIDRIGAEWNVAPAEIGRGPPRVAHAAALGRTQIGEHPQQGRLARAVGPDEADHLARARGEIDAFEQHGRTEAHGNAFRLDLHHASSRSR